MLPGPIFNVELLTSAGEGGISSLRGLRHGAVGRPVGGVSVDDRNVRPHYRQLGRTTSTP